MILDLILFASSSALFTYYNTKSGAPVDIIHSESIVVAPLGYGPLDPTVYYKLLSGNVPIDILQKLSEIAVSRFVAVGSIPECIEDRIVEILLHTTIPEKHVCLNSFESVINNYTTQTIEIIAHNKLPIHVVTSIISYIC